MTETPGETIPQQNTPQAPVSETKVGMWSCGSGDTSGYSRIQRQLFMPGRTEGPFGEPFDTIAVHVRQLVLALTGDLMLLDRGKLTIFVPHEHLRGIVKVFRGDVHLRFGICVSASGVHYPQQIGAELYVVYHLLPITHDRRVRLEVTVPDDDPHVPSAVATYPVADWHERETWDMFGTLFDGHPPLAHTLMPDDWVGHPQRKDYPLGGIDIQYKGATVPAPDHQRMYN